MSVLIFVLLWMLLTVPLALLVGKCFKAGNASGDARAAAHQAEQPAVRVAPAGSFRASRLQDDPHPMLIGNHPT